MGKASRSKRKRTGSPPPGSPQPAAGRPIGPIQLPISLQLIQAPHAGTKQPCDSLLDEMVEGQEYVSIIDKAPRKLDFRNEIRRALAEIEDVRHRPVIVYAANQVQPFPGSTAIVPADGLPFAELVGSVPANETAVDIIIESPGGASEQISDFVQRLRPRFQDVSFIVLNRAMSAATLFALSGNEIWMDERAVLGPIDPQVATTDGRLIPYQALLTLIKDIQERGEEALKKNQQPLWTDIQILRNIDSREIGNALAQTLYVIQVATEYLKSYKFRDWVVHSTTRLPVTPEDRANRAKAVAETLCSHQQWRVHSHGISRNVAWEVVQLKIEHPEKVTGFQRAMRRLWALLYWMFEHGRIQKLLIGQHYSLFRGVPVPAPALGGQP